MTQRIDDKRAAEIAAAIRYDGSGRGILLRDLLADRAELMAEIERLKAELVGKDVTNVPTNHG